MTAGQRPLLALSAVTKAFGGVHALDNVSLNVLPKQIAGIIGPNGAGKTTTFNIITGAYRPSRGMVLLGGTDISNEPSYRIARAGISRTFQNIRLFADLTVWEHLLVAQPHGEFALRRLLPTRWANHSSSSNLKTSGNGLRARCRMASSAGSRWLARSPPDPNCCCSTSRWPE
jgi:branched-chain amino acid transport system ATP-binding protein